MILHPVSLFMSLRHLELSVNWSELRFSEGLLAEN
jgi:hypothetical protein